MKRKKLLFAMLCIASALGMRAQTDVTSTYITNADFSSTDGWTQSHSDGTFWALGNGNIGSYAVVNSMTSTTDATHLSTEYCFGMQCRWSTSYAAFTQTKSSASLPAGVYTLTYDVQNTNTSTTSATYVNNFFAQVGDTKYSDSKTEWMSGNSNWTTHTISFSIDTDATENFTISLGYGTGSNNFGSGNTPHLYVSHLVMTYAAFIRPTAITLNKTSLTLTTGSQSTLSVDSYTPADANKDIEITWTSSDETVATVSSAGVVTALKAGSATITATTANDKSASCSVTVADAAAPSAYSSIGEGEFYIVNAATGKFLGGANSWGTQASLIDHGIPFTIAESDGTYTLDSHTYNSETQHFLTGTYVDGASTNLYITEISSGKFSISTADGSAYLTATAGSTVVANSAANANSSLAQWYFVSKDDRDELFASATDASPVEATYYIPNASFSRNMNTEYNEKRWSVTASNSNLASDANCAESWHSTFNVTQTISLPNGKYTFRAQGFHSGSRAPYFFVGDETIPFPAQTGSEASMSAAAASFLAGEYYTEYATVYVTNGSLTLGCKLESGTDDWCIWDNFELRYHGPIIGGEATEIPMDTETAMTADKWYYIDIPANGMYNLTTTTLSNIVYTTDGTILIEDESDVTDKFSKAENEELTAGRYYVKSSSAQSLEVTVGAYTYAVGSPTFSTADDGYTQNNTFTVTFTSAATNDPDAETALVASSKGTVNGNEVALSAVTNGFSLNLGSLTANTNYRIIVPANVYGYTGENMNAAIDITIHTPAAFDGFYFLRTSAGKYVARGGDYNSRAVVDEFGLPLNVTTDASGITQFTYVDNGGKLFLNGSGNAFTDNDTDPDWTFEATEGGYYLVHTNGTYNGKKLNVWSGDSKSLYATGTEGTVFVIEPVSEHNTYMEALKDAQAATASAANGNDAITTKEDLASWLATNYNAVDITVPAVSFTEKWNGDASAEWGAGKDMYSNTISSLPEGLYKLTVNAYYRINGSATAAEGARGNTYLYGGSAKTQLYSLKDFPAAEAWSGRNQNDAAGYYPDDVTSGTAATTSSYLTELYVYHEGGDFKYGIHQPSRFSNGEWFGYQNFTLTRYESTMEVEVTSAGYATYASDHALDFTDSEIEAYIATTKGDGTGVNFTQINKVPAGTGVLLYKAGGTTEDIPIFDGTGAEDVTDNVFVRGAGETVASVDGNLHNYILNKPSEKPLGFYKAAGQMVATNRAYIQIDESAGVKEFFTLPGMEDGADGISTIDNGELTIDNAAIYNLAGQRLNKVQKGVNIVNGKKILK
ncbi:MAG: Ig domain-containing protein [Bacteroidaceae bacterium]|nr:Ig domain-containing protein [Bacteroidaceae bacterium]